MSRRVFLLVLETDPSVPSFSWLKSPSSLALESGGREALSDASVFEAFSAARLSTCLVGVELQRPLAEKYRGVAIVEGQTGWGVQPAKRAQGILRMLAGRPSAQ